MAEFASNAKANTGVTLGAIGTGLAVLGPHLGNFLGGMNNGYVSKEAFDLQKQVSAKDSEIALLKSEANTEVKIADVYERLEKQMLDLERAQNGKWADQSVYNATNTATVSVMGSQVAQLQSLVKMVIPSDNVCPKPMPQFNSWTAPTA